MMYCFSCRYYVKNILNLLSCTIIFTCNRSGTIHILYKKLEYYFDDRFGSGLIFLFLNLRQDAEECWTQLLYTLSQSLRLSGSR